MSKSPVSSRDVELLSAYLDRQLGRFQRQRLEARLQKNEALQVTLEDLRRTRAMLRTLPSLRAPRNFTLTPAMAGVQSQPNRLPALGFGLVSALASFLLVMILAGDWLLSTSGARQVASNEPPTAQAVLPAFKQEQPLAPFPTATSTPEAAQVMAERQAAPTTEAGMSANMVPTTPTPEGEMFDLKQVAPAPSEGTGLLAATEEAAPTQAEELALPAPQETLPVVTPAPGEPEATVVAELSTSQPTPTSAKRSVQPFLGIDSSERHGLFILAEIALALIALVSGGVALLLRSRSG